MNVSECQVGFVLKDGACLIERLHLSFSSSDLCDHEFSCKHFFINCVFSWGKNRKRKGNNFPFFYVYFHYINVE